MPTAAAAPSVAVVGCGLAGMLSALELLHNNITRLTIIERDAKCGAGVSGSAMGFMSFDLFDFYRSPPVLPLPLGNRVSKSAAEARRRRDPRTAAYLQAKFIKASEKQLLGLLHRHPALCEAVLVDACCAKATPMRRWMDVNWRSLGQRCGEGSVASVRLGRAADHADAPTSRRQVAWLGKLLLQHSPVHYGGPDDDAEALVELGRRGGHAFVHTELLPGVVRRILVSASVKLQLGVELLSADVSVGGVCLGTRRTAAAAGHERACYDRVLFTTGAAIGPALDAIDPQLAFQVLPHFGVTADLRRHLPPADRWTATILPTEFFFARALGRDGHHARYQAKLKTKVASGKVKLSLGIFGPSAHDHDVRRYQAGLRAQALRAACRQDGCGNATMMLFARPMSYLGNFPVLKRHPSGRVAVFTGLGCHGYTLAWKAASIAAELLLEGRPRERWASDSYSIVGSAGGAAYLVGGTSMKHDHDHRA